MKKFAFLLGVLLIVLSLTWPVHAQAPYCEATIIHQPQYGGLPAKVAPTYWSTDTGGVFYVGTITRVYGQYFNPLNGEVWYYVGGWIQAYSGWSTDVTNIVFNSPTCAVL